MTRMTLLVLAGSLGLGAIVADVARADDAAPATLAIEPWASFDGVDRPYRYIVTIAPVGDAPVEVVADRRMLSFEVRPAESRRRYRCQHPRVQRNVSDGRVRTLRRGGEDATWREWIDLRMYCTGRALDALTAGAEVQASYGWRRASRRRWVARAPGSTSTRTWTGRFEPESFLFPARSEPSETARVGAEPSDPPSPVTVRLAPGSAGTEAALSLRVSVRARSGTERVYVRPDSWSFRVDGPLGRTQCRVEGGGGSPPPDLYRRVTARLAAAESLDAEYFCPAGTFELAGVYEVQPKLRLAHDGEAYGLSAVTGRFIGPTSVIRITSGDRGYLEQVPVRAADRGAADE